MHTPDPNRPHPTPPPREAPMPEIGTAQSSLEGNFAELTRRDVEVSEKLRTSFAAIEAHLTEVGVKASAVDGM